MLDRDLLVETAEWRLLSLLFEYPAGDWRARVAALSEEVRDPDLRDAGHAALREAGEGMHHSLLGPGGPVSPREATYTQGVQLGYLMSELAAYYEAFSYQHQGREAHDHIAVEAGFVAYLKLKEAYARASGDGEHAAICSEAARQFAAEHLSAMAAPLAEALERIAPSYLVLAGRALLARVGPPKRPVAVSPEEEEMSCGEEAGTGLIELQP